MNQKNKLFAASIFLLLVIAACKKNNSSKQVTPTVDNLAGTYTLTGATWLYNGVTYNIYDSLDACEKDDLTTLNKDSTYIVTDAGVKCNPPDDSNGNWLLSGDSLFVDGNGARIKSFDGKTLVYSGYADANGVVDPSVIATITLTKQ